MPNVLLGHVFNLQLQSHATHVNAELENVEDVKDVACVEELLSRSKVFRDTHEECLGCTQKFAHVVTVDLTVDTGILHTHAILVTILVLS